MADDVITQPAPLYPIASVDNALRLLTLVVERGEVRLADASRELGVAPSTAHRLMQMLTYHGLAKQQDDGKAYCPGPVLRKLGLEVVGDIDIRVVARPWLEELRDRLEETVHLFAFDGRQLWCLDSLEGRRALRVGVRTGMALPTHGSAGGRAILAELSTSRLRELFPSSRLPKTAGRPTFTRAELERELELVRERGYAVQQEETEAGISAIAAAIPEPSGATSVVTVAIPTSRLDLGDIPRFGAAVRSCAAEIGESLRGR